MSTAEALVTDDLGGGLTPDENRYFETGGATEIPAGGAPSNDNAAAPGEQQPGGQQKAEEKSDALVPHAALHEERTKRKALEAEFRASQKELAELRGKFSIIDRLNQPQGQQQAKEPTAEEDIFGAVNNTTKALAEIRKDIADQRAALQEERAREGVLTGYRSAAAQFAASTPEFGAAYSFLLQSRAAELQAIGITDPAEIKAALDADEFSIAQRALQAGQNPAQILYKLAEGRGYKKADPQGSQNGQRGTQQQSGAEKLANIERGQQANKSLSATGGASGDVGMTAETLLKMPMDEFDAWCSKHPAQAKRIMGG